MTLTQYKITLDNGKVHVVDCDNRTTAQEMARLYAMGCGRGVKRIEEVK